MSRALLIISLASCSQLLLSEAARWFNPVPLCNRACCYKGIHVPIRKSVNLKCPCVNLECQALNGTHGNLVVTGCVQVAAKSPYIVRPGGNGPFPTCCPTLRHGKASNGPLKLCNGPRYL
uniref:Putative 8.9 kDa family member n=1 Tax=Rhipicephalus pulchellus TaxID=72859 RepID=L7MAA2_RHIPC